MLLDQLNNASIVGIDLQLLGALEHYLDRSVGDLIFEVQPQSLSITDDLGGVLGERDEQSPRLLFYRPFPQELRTQHGLSPPRNSDNHGGGAIKNAAADECVNSLNPDNGPHVAGCGLH